MPPRATRHILVVEDNADSAEMLGAYLEAFGNAVSIAYDGESALFIAERVRPAAVITDIGLPLIDGFTLALKLREMLGPSFVLFALSAYTAPEYADRARLAGIDRYFTKPGDPDVILRALDAFER